jgi:hypothetical protein
MHERESVITHFHKLCTNLMDDLAIVNIFINDDETIANFLWSVPKSYVSVLMPKLKPSIH